MKSTAIVSAILCASLGFSTLSFGQDYERHGPRQDQRQDQRQEQRQDERHYRQDERHDQRHDRDQRFEHSERRYGHEAYYNARGPAFRRGGYIPREYRNNYYTVADYRSHRLSPPPRGHQWVQVGSDYVLIAIATGLIAGMVLSN